MVAHLHYQLPNNSKLVLEQDKCSLKQTTHLYYSDNRILMKINLAQWSLNKQVARQFQSRISIF